MNAIPAVKSQTLDDNRHDEDCYHCGLPLPHSASVEQPINGTPQRFCCPACHLVCHAIHDANLEGFYQRTPSNVKRAPPPPAGKDLALYDLDAVQAEFVSALTEERKISLLVEGIHCAACVWLIERSLEHVPGVINAQVNLSGKQLLLHWNNKRIPLSAVLQKLGSIGYAALPFDPLVAQAKYKNQNRGLLLRMAFAGFAMMNLLWISIALYSGASDGEFRNLFHWVGLGLATPVLLYSGYPFLRNAWIGLTNRHLTMDLPIAIGATTTFLYSTYITLFAPAAGEVYFDTLVNFLFVILVGRYLEAMTKQQVIASTQRLLDLQPRGANVVQDGALRLLPIRSVKVGDRVVVKPGDLIPVDGVVEDGFSAVNEAMLSGESKPVVKHPADSVSAGTLNLDSALTVRVRQVLNGTALGRIIHLVQEAQASKAPIQCLADRVVPWFVATTLLLASITFTWWLSSSFELALMAATAVLIITCPCAFGLATPMTIASASGLGSRNGILIKNGAALEALSQVNHFVFDKTGTLTEGHMQVQEVISDGVFTKTQLLELAAAVENYSEHNIAKAICIASADVSGPANDSTNTISVGGQVSAQNVQSQAGLGIKGVVGETQVMVGTRDWLQKNNVGVNTQLLKEVTRLEQQGVSCVFVAVDKQHCGIIAVTDQLRAGAKRLTKLLQRHKMKVSVLSGDRKPVVAAIARQLGNVETIAEVLPEQKDQVIRHLQSQGDTVAMIGDGVNDAPALVRANVGISLGSGTDISAENADIVLMNNDLNAVWLSRQLALRSIRTIRQNIGISIVYNIIMVPMAMAAIITPLIAAISMPVSSLLVIANAARIRTVFKTQVVKNGNCQQ